MRSRSWLPLSRAVGSKPLAIISTSATWFNPIIRVFSVRRSPGRIGRRNRVCSVANGPKQSDDQGIEVRVAAADPEPVVSRTSRSPSTRPVVRWGVGPMRISLEKRSNCPCGVSTLVLRISSWVIWPSRFTAR